MKKKPRIYISTGERSGAVYAGLLAGYLEAKAEVIMGFADTRFQAPVGFLAGLGSFSSSIKSMKVIEREVRMIKPDVFLAVAWSEPNLILGLRLADMADMRRVFFAPPQVWAWGRFRAGLIRRGYHHLACLYPREAEMLCGMGLPARFVGNPLAWYLKPHLKRKVKRKGVALLPGSRPGEWAKNIQPLIFFRQRWEQIHPEDSAVWVFLEELDISQVSSIPLRPGDGMVSGEARYEAISRARLAIVASGTATLETALQGTPQVVFYRISPVERILIKELARVSRFALPNLVLGRDAVPELLNPSIDELTEKAEELLPAGNDSLRLAEELHAELGNSLDKLPALLNII